jgi:hypothetical protein
MFGENGASGSDPAWTAIEFFSVYNSARDDRNTRLRGRFRAARGIGERSEPGIRPICGSSYRQNIALTFTDYLSIKNRQARRFEQLQPDTIRFIQEVERVAGAPVSLIATRFHFRSIIDRGAW